MLPIVLRGARTHNLGGHPRGDAGGAGVDLTFEPGELVGVAGVSGAGKSSLAIDTLYSEGQRRFVESFSPYARQFLERLERPPTERLDPIAAGVAVDRRAPVKSSRSTVATMADLEPYLSALYLREAVPTCPRCAVPAVHDDPSRAALRALRDHAGARALVTMPLRLRGAEAYLDARERLVARGYRRVLVGGLVRDLDTVTPSDAMSPGFSVVIDRLALAAHEHPRLAGAIEEAWREGEGTAELCVQGEGGASAPSQPIASFRRELSCPSCARSFEPPRPGLFSYQSPLGACATCRGFGRTIGVDWRKVIPDERLSLAKGAIRPWTSKIATWERRVLAKFCARVGVPMDRPWGELGAEAQRLVIEGEGTWHGGKYPGLRAWFEWLETRTYKMHVRVLLSRYRSYDPCAACDGKRLSAASLAYRVDDKDLATFHGLELGEARACLERLRTTSGQGELARRELVSRLAYLERVGLGYLTLDRQARTLSGGEAQRVGLTAALGTSLTGALFVIDEPTVGLGPSDQQPLEALLRELADRGNVVLVVEHEAALLSACDRVIELGPGAGPEGGRVVFDGTPQALARASTATGRALAAPLAPRLEPKRPSGALELRGVRAHNLADVTVSLPLGVVCAITGPSGSGKSTLVTDVLYRALARARGELDVEPPGAHDGLAGDDAIRSVTLVDQAPLGRTSRGNPATYSGAWSHVRALFAKTPDALARELGPGAFSFNVAGGRCDACSGEGFETVEMQFLADVSLVCASCGGRRFQDAVLAVKLRERSVADVLAMTVDEALSFFARERAITRALGPLAMLGLGYLGLGQPLSTLSGGEAQRLKLARALAAPKKTELVLLDEPSAGLHPSEVARLVAALHALARATAGVVVVEHDLAVLAESDWIVELGPGAGREGGRVVFEGTAAKLAEAPTRTGRALAAARSPRATDGARAREARAPAPRAIEVEHAREHNLRDVSTSVPHGALVVVTGPSGSGKSTLAFDVIFAEGQRRFLETLTPYARQFLPTLPRPSVDRVTGVPPSVALEQRRTRAGLSSTVSTVTEVGHYLRLLFAKVGTPHCPDCDVPIEPRARAAIFEALRKKRRGALLVPVVTARKGSHREVFVAAARDGALRARVDGAVVATTPPPKLAKTREHTIELVLREGSLASLDEETLARALEQGGGAVRFTRALDEPGELYSTTRACPRCGKGVPELDPRFFSFNTKQGQCSTCEGSGFAEGDDDALEARAPCAACGGSRLSPLPRSVRLAGRRLHEIERLPLDESLAFARALRFEGDARKVAEAPLGELVRRLEFARSVGLSYLSLDRRAATLSGGEMQRLRLSAQLGSGLTGALYVLDEPTIGLHPRDTSRLLDNLRALVRMGSTVLLVEHDADTIRAADHVIDLGPGGGASGGRIVAEGPAHLVLASPLSPTGRALADEASAPKLRTPSPTPRGHERVVLRGAREHNLRVRELSLPLARLNVVAGVSGSGKSTLVRRVLLPAAQRALGLEGPTPGLHDELVLPRSVTRVVAVDQSPIGRTPRSVPATFLGIWDHVRKLFALSPEARVRGYGPARFSFNTGAGGRCATCEGQGSVTHEMSFLPDVTTPCPDCGGARFEPRTLEARYLGVSIGEVLERTAEEAAELFHAHRAVSGPLELMKSLGIGYLKLGQGSHTLSGGEAQRLKLAAELGASSRAGGSTLYVLDEPTTGLHLSDVARLVTVLDRLVARGDTLVVIEHHPTVLACADHLVELGPEGGVAGGLVVAEGTPGEVARADTPTGEVLRRLFG